MLVVSPQTKVWLGGKLLTRPRATTELGGADTVTATVRPLAQRRWSKDEDGSAVPTFRASRVLITD